jgi:hypothetical protein
MCNFPLQTEITEPLATDTDDERVGAASVRRMVARLPGTLAGSETMRRTIGRIRSWVTATSFADCLVILFTAALTFTSLYQFIILRGQLDVMRKDQRAWVTAAPGIPETPSSGTGKVLRIPVEVKNSGKTAARDVKVEVVARIIKNGDQAQCDYGKQVPGMNRTDRVFQPNAVRNFYGDVLSVADTTKTIAQLRVLSADDIQRLADGREFFVVYGRVTYKDVFNQSHWVHFCSWGSLSTKPMRFTSGACYSYNEIDGD